MASYQWDQFHALKSVQLPELGDDYIGSVHFKGRPELARAYIKARAKDAVECYRLSKEKDIYPIANAVELAQTLAKYW